MGKKSRRRAANTAPPASDARADVPADVPAVPPDVAREYSSEFVNHYVEVSRASEAVGYVDPVTGDISVKTVEQAAAALTLKTEGEFKPSWATYMVNRDHIAFERMDLEKNFDEMSAMMSGERGEFLKWHMRVTERIWGAWAFESAQKTIYDHILAAVGTGPMKYCMRDIPSASP